MFYIGSRVIGDSSRLFLVGILLALSSTSLTFTSLCVYVHVAQSFNSRINGMGASFHSSGITCV